MKYTEPTFRNLVDQMFDKTMGITTADLPDWSLWEYFDLEYDYTQKEINECVQQAFIDGLVEADAPSDLLIEIMQDVIKLQTNTLGEI
jgi:hypothetical protein